MKLREPEFEEVLLFGWLIILIALVALVGEALVVEASRG